MTEIVKLVIMDMRIDDIRGVLEAFLRPSTDARQAGKRSRILRAATRLFVAHGYRKTSVEDVARAAGVAKGTVYLYYSNKAELLLHAAISEQLHYLSALEPIFDAALAPLDRLRGYIGLAIIWGNKLPLLARFSGGDDELEQVFRELDAGIFERVSEAEIDFVTRLIQAAVAPRVPASELRQRASALIDLMFALVTRGRMLHTDMPIEDYAQMMADILVQGILHQPHTVVALEFLHQNSAAQSAPSAQTQ